MTVISSSEDVGCGCNRSIVAWWWWFIIIFVPACRIRLEGIQVELDAPLQFKVLSKLNCLLCIHTSPPFSSLSPHPFCNSPTAYGNTLLWIKELRMIFYSFKKMNSLIKPTSPTIPSLEIKTSMLLALLSLMLENWMNLAL